MTVAEVKTFIEQNASSKEVQDFVSGLNPISEDKVKTYLTNDEKGKTILTSLTDSNISKAIETFKTKTMPGIIQAEVAKVTNPETTPEQKRLKVLEESNALLARENKISKIKGLVSIEADTHKIPMKLFEKMDLAVLEEVQVKDFVKEVGEVWTGALKETVKDLQKTFGRSVHGTGGNDKKTATQTINDTIRNAAGIKVMAQ